MKKFFLFLLMIPMLFLTACGASTPSGVYSFSMGNQSDTHFGVKVTLYDEVYGGTGEHADDKKLSLILDVSEEAIPTPPEDPEDERYFTKLSSYIMMMTLSEGVNGYYYTINQPEENVDGWQRLHIGIDLFDLVKRILNKLIEDSQIIKTILDLIQGYIADIPDSYFNKILLASIKNNKEIKLVLPVSIMDLQCQLCWYGLFININLMELKEGNVKNLKIVDLTHDENVIDPTTGKPKFRPLPGPYGDREEDIEKRLGTHPVVNEQYDHVTSMNSMFSEVFKNEDGKTIFNFRDFHTLEIGLTKEQENPPKSTEK